MANLYGIKLPLPSSWCRFHGNGETKTAASSLIPGSANASWVCILQRDLKYVILIHWFLCVHEERTVSNWWQAVFHYGANRVPQEQKNTLGCCTVCVPGNPLLLVTPLVFVQHFIIANLLPYLSEMKWIFIHQSFIYSRIFTHSFIRAKCSPERRFTVYLSTDSYFTIFPICQSICLSTHWLICPLFVLYIHQTVLPFNV